MLLLSVAAVTLGLGLIMTVEIFEAALPGRPLLTSGIGTTASTAYLRCAAHAQHVGVDELVDAAIDLSRRQGAVWVYLTGELGPEPCTGWRGGRGAVGGTAPAFSCGDARDESAVLWRYSGHGDAP